jgi:hypothetical protein
LFAPDSAWNQRVDQTAVLASSDRQVLVTYRVLRGDASHQHPPGPPPTTWPFADVNLDHYAIPVYRAGSEEQSVWVCDYSGNIGWPGPKFPAHQGKGGPVSVPAPAGTIRPAGPQDTDADGHVVLYQPDTFLAYDFWQATTVRDGRCRSRGGGLLGTAIFEAGAIDYFDVRGPGANPDTYYSARATGVPLLAGLILPEDVERGEIAHALALAIPGLRNLSPDPSQPQPSDIHYPASTTETDFYSTHADALAAGQRLRLKPSLVDEEGLQIDEQGLAPITRMLIAALRTHGAIVVDNAGGFTFYAEDVHSAVLHLDPDRVNELIGHPPGTALPPDVTRWQAVIETLNLELERIPFAYGPWVEGQDLSTAAVTTANYEVIEPAARPEARATAYEPLVLKDASYPVATTVPNPSHRSRP